MKYRWCALRFLSRGLAACLLVFGFVSAGLAGELTVSYEDPESFEDFTIHEQWTTEDAQIIFGRELKAYWDRRMSAHAPEDWNLELRFTEIDMAGRVQPERHPTGKRVRFYENRFFPRLFFVYTFTNAAGKEMKAGEAKVMDTNFDFGGSGRMLQGEFAFPYELEAIRKWLESLKLKQTDK